MSSEPHGPGPVPVELRVNGGTVQLSLEPRRTLLEALRVDVGLTGTKSVCGMGDCGACTVLLDGKAVYSCLVLALECQGQEITTIEGLADEGRLHPLQAAFIQHDGLQCGYCTPGQILAAADLLSRTPDPSPDEIRRGVSGNLCRCGAYLGIFRAIAAAAAELRQEGR
jgi:xanthine dehydrogenase YagT iron-sulfur-binding subunit